MPYREREISRDGDVVCDCCGEYLGNIYTDDYFSLLRKKYCDKCGEMMLRQMWRTASAKRRRKQKLERKLLKEQNELIKEENELLRRQLIQLRRASNG